jgi:predicted metal-dependent hydrolase
LAGGAIPAAVPGPHGAIPLEVRTNPRARWMTLRVCSSSRTVRLTLPPRASRARAAAFLADQQGWIAAQVSLRLPPPLAFQAGTLLPLGDGQLLLAPGTGRTARREGDRLLVPGGSPLFEGRVRRWLSAEARRVLEPATRTLAAGIGKEVRDVRVGDFSSRWGSCAADGRIAYNWRLVLAPGHVQQAVVAHEVAHLAHPNHGSAFWALATELLGAPHTAARTWLRVNGPWLHSVGAPR